MFYCICRYRFPDMFPDMENIRYMQKELDLIIQQGVINITKLLQNTESNISLGPLDNEEDFEVQWHSKAVGDATQQKKKPASIEKTADSNITYSNDVGVENLVKNDVLSKKPISAVSACDSYLSSQDSVISLQQSHRLVDELVKKGIINKGLLEKLQKELGEANKN